MAVRTWLCSSASCCHEWETVEPAPLCPWCLAPGPLLLDEKALPNYQAIADAIRCLEDPEV